MTQTITLSWPTIGALIGVIASIGGAGSWTFNEMQKYNERMAKIESNEQHHEKTDRRVQALECFLEVRPLWDCPEIARLVASQPAPPPPPSMSMWAEEPAAMAEVSAPIEDPWTVEESSMAEDVWPEAEAALEALTDLAPAAGVIAPDADRELTFEQRAYEAILGEIPAKEESQ